MRKKHQAVHISTLAKKNFCNEISLGDYTYEEEIIDFDKMMADMEDLANRYAIANKINEEIIIVLIVYETPTNPCSERKPLQDFFNAHGVECKELDYPINSLASIKDEPFDF